MLLVVKIRLHRSWSDTLLPGLPKQICLGFRPAPLPCGRESLPAASAMKSLREILNARPKDRMIAAPGVYDMVSLRMAAQMGFDAL